MASKPNHRETQQEYLRAILAAIYTRNRKQIFQMHELTARNLQPFQLCPINFNSAKWHAKVAGSCSKAWMRNALRYLLLENIEYCISKSTRLQSSEMKQTMSSFVATTPCWAHLSRLGMEETLMSLTPSAMVRLVMVKADHMIPLLDPQKFQNLRGQHQTLGQFATWFHVHHLPCPLVGTMATSATSRWNKHSSTDCPCDASQKHMGYGSIPSRPELLLLWSLALMEMALLLVHLFASNMQPPVNGHTTHEGNLDIPWTTWRFLIPFPNRDMHLGQRS